MSPVQALFEHEMRCRGVVASWEDVDEEDRAAWQKSVDVVTHTMSSALDTSLKEIARLRLALEDVRNPLAYLQRFADAEGSRLSGMAYTIANDIQTAKVIARDALSAKPLNVDSVAEFMAETYGTLGPDHQLDY